MLKDSLGKNAGDFVSQIWQQIDDEDSKYIIVQFRDSILSDLEETEINFIGAKRDNGKVFR